MSDGPLPVFATAISSFRFVLTHRRELLRVGLLAVPAFLIITLGLDSFESTRIADHGPMIDVIRSLIDLGARAVVATIILVTWHRVVMSKAAGRKADLSVAFGLREVRYLLLWVMLSAAFLGVFAAVLMAAVITQFLAMLGLYLVLLLVGLADTLVIGQRDQFVIVLWISVFFAVPAAIYVTGRLTLVLPALAVDSRRALRQAWRLSAGNGWRLAAASLLVLVPMESIAALCSTAAGSARHTAAYVPLATAAATSLFLLIVLTGTVLSLFSLRLDSAAGRDDTYHTGIAVAE